MKSIKQFNFIVVGLGSIGKNLAKYLLSKNLKIKIWDKNSYKTNIICKELGIKFNNSFTKNIEKKNNILILAINSGPTVDEYLSKYLRSLKKIDFVIDIGNNHPEDTIRRFNYLKKQKINYINPGFSGGIDGALGKASLMLSCKNIEFEKLKEIFCLLVGNQNKKSLKLVGNKPNAGNYVKIAHNAIEYAIIQSIADFYFISKEIFGLKNKNIVEEINYIKSQIKNCYLLNITEDILKKKNKLSSLIDKVDDNNTGSWASKFALDCKYSMPIISSSVDARYLSKSNRFAIKKEFKKKFKNKIRDFSKLLILNIKASYIQGIGLLDQINKNNQIKIYLNNSLLSWQYNSIIRSDYLKEIKKNIKQNKIDIFAVYKKIFDTKTQIFYFKVSNFLSLNNFYVPSIFSVCIWLFYHQKNLFFSSNALIQKLRNKFGNHEIKYK